ncbi:MAG TPA: hypothetical protein VJV21_04710 [Pyrinomonadaceae bacterium]|nr:hypothetical protein [Pyrinomonadaceae bacterium]
MNKITRGFYASLLMALTSLTVYAQADRTYVSGTGDDINSCSRTQPCRTFAGAISKTKAGGEINALDASGYGAVTISKSLTIDATGTLGSVHAANANGIIINMTQVKDIANASVRLRGLTINGLGTGINGINIIESGKVSIEDCVIDGFKSSGIYVGMGTVFVSNTTIRNNVTAGITVKSGTKAALANVALVFNGVGIAGTAKQLGPVYLYGNTTGDPP